MIFLSYAREDEGEALRIHDKLKTLGFDVWIDQRNLRPGQEWEPLIWAAASKARLFCILLSNKSVNKSGFIRKEMRFALDKWKEKLSDDIYLVPCLIENIDPPNEFRHIQYQKLLTDEDFENFVANLRTILNVNNEKRDAGEGVPHFENISILHESKYWDINVEYPKFFDDDLYRLNIAIRNFALSSAEEPEEDAEVVNDFPKSFYSSDYIVSSGSKHLVSVQYSSHIYFSGAVHPNHGFATFNFERRSGALFKIDDMFGGEKALKVVSRYCQYELMKQRSVDLWGDDDEHGSADEWIRNGAGPDWENFGQFSIDNTHLNILFNAYVVGPYAWGPRVVKVPISDLAHLFNDRFGSALRQGSQE